MTSANKVGEIFAAAGTAFSRLGELTMQLHPIEEPSQSSGKWSATEVQMLKNAVTKFSEDLNRISDIVKSRSMTQMKAQLKRKAYENAGISLPVESTTPKSPKAAATIKSPRRSTEGKTKSPSQNSGKKQKTGGDMTLTTLNASEYEVDIETIGDQSGKKVKLEFDSDLEPAGL